MSEKIPLPKYLKMLTSGNIPVAKAMTISSKIYKEYNTAEQLSQLTDTKLKAFGVDEKDIRRLVLTAVKKAGHTLKRVSEPEQPTASTSGNSFPPSTVDVITTPTKRKRKRNEQADKYLPEGPVDEASLYGSLEFKEILDENMLRTKSVIINRAPLMTAWATVVAERMGFQREEALSIASVYTEINAISKGVSLGIFKEGKEKGLDALRGGTQPYVDFIGRRPLYRNQKEQWRALLHGTPATPSAAFGYISRSFRQTTPYVVGTLRLLADSYSPQEINNKAWSLYADFRPEVNGWGKRSEVKCLNILDLRKPSSDADPTNGSESADRTPINIQYKEVSEESEPATELESKRRRSSSAVEDYEKALDEDHELNNAILVADF
ncbi:hypothetical protein E1B28_004278 [Marasmius oreades]|uniref:Uncharacterized protein n=1 Tax=Marasmius oreades TaxID=181124 RepID=A0A9P7UYB5_9AGAR|nr:uncharacterized protein E1B28_004278 [Marasmius oreades]KAG7096871.1 hypothetical protein E1B28_004278 [Marasmius oreades]